MNGLVEELIKEAYGETSDSPSALEVDVVSGTSVKRFHAHVPRDAGEIAKIQQQADILCKMDKNTAHPDWYPYLPISPKTAYNVALLRGCDVQYAGTVEDKKDPEGNLLKDKEGKTIDVFLPLETPQSFGDIEWLHLSKNWGGPFTLLVSPIRSALIGFRLQDEVETVKALGES